MPNMSMRTGAPGMSFPLKAPHLYALAARLDGIAGSILNDLDRMEKGENR